MLYIQACPCCFIFAKPSRMRVGTRTPGMFSARNAATVLVDFFTAGAAVFFALLAICVGYLFEFKDMETIGGALQGSILHATRTACTALAPMCKAPRAALVPEPAA